MKIDLDTTDIDRRFWEAVRREELYAEDQKQMEDIITSYWEQVVIVIGLKGQGHARSLSSSVRL